MGFRDYAAFLGRLHDEFGPIATFDLPSTTVCAVFDAELMQEALVAKRACFEKGPALKRAGFLGGSTILTGDGEPHRRRRRLLLPAFHGEALAGYAGLVIGAAADLSGGWRDGATVDLAAEMQRLTLRIETGAFFGTDSRVEPAVLSDAIEGMRWDMKLLFLPWSGLLRRLPLPQSRKARRAFGRLDAAIREVVRKARADTGARVDLVSLLARARDEAGGYAALSDSEVRDECYAVLLAAHEATVNAMVWAFHHLACRPETQVRLERELDAVLAGRPPAPADLESLPFARAVFDETLRLTPPIAFFGRRAIADCTIGGYRIPAGTTVQMAVLTAQRDPRHFPEPDRFLPERWLEEGGGPGDGIAFLAFGGGNRLCVGGAFARMAAVLVLATVVQRWRFQPLLAGPVETTSLVIYRPKHGLPMRLMARRDVPASDGGARA
ncbi:cytochrome P450 [Tistlia consotensis]|uniref:cytochrome P450 n=1 Tax=Tistlia consotensis TaxID=1321365 RepID=UPI001356366D|nr:cytochrome P450 [Tistlia consotensis]